MDDTFMSFVPACASEAGNCVFCDRIGEIPLQHETFKTENQDKRENRPRNDEGIFHIQSCRLPQPVVA
ncbi:MAG: hypothetical protein ABR973_12910 [Candidatus Acidiferrales bacterium]